MPRKGIKKQVLGIVLLSLGAITTLLAQTIGFELDIFYVVISLVGAGLFLLGTIQRSIQISKQSSKQKKSAS